MPYTTRWSHQKGAGVDHEEQEAALVVVRQVAARLGTEYSRNDKSSKAVTSMLAYATVLSIWRFEAVAGIGAGFS